MFKALIPVGGLAARITSRARILTRSEAPTGRGQQRHRQLAKGAHELGQPPSGIMGRDAHSKNSPRLETARHRIELGAPHNLLQRSDRPHPAVRDQYDRTGQPRHLGDRMADIDDRHTRLVAQALDIREDLILTLGIERGQRLVHQQQPRAG